MKVCVAGQGAFGQKHLDALKRIPEVEVTSLVGGNQDATAQIAKKYGIPQSPCQSSRRNSWAREPSLVMSKDEDELTHGE